MVKLKKYLVVLVALFLIVSGCSAGGSRGEQERVEARMEQELYEREIFEDGIAQGHYEARADIEEIKYSFSSGAYVEVDALIDIIYTEFDEAKAEDIVDRIVYHPDIIMVYPREIIDNAVK